MLTLINSNYSDILSENYLNEINIYDINEIFIQDESSNLSKSENFLNFSRLLNVIFSILVILFGLIGNLLIINVFSNKRFRTNPNDVYLYSLAFIDTTFLIVHFIEDTIKTYNDLYEEYSNILIKIPNILDKSNLACWAINYIRHISRLISANILVVLTVQRLIVVIKPFSVRLRTKKSAWNIVFAITCASICFCVWIPFLFKIQDNEQKSMYCGIDKNMTKLYRIINIVYVFLIMIGPMIIICVSNSLLIFKTFRNNANRSKITNKNKTSNINSNNNTSNTSNNNSSNTKQLVAVKYNKNKSQIKKVRPYYLTMQQVISKAKINSKINSKKITMMLVLITFSFVALNLPYLITWCLYFKFVYFNKFNNNTFLVNNNNLLAMLKLSEIFFIINYSLKLYLYCAGGSNFRKQLNLVVLSNKYYIFFIFKTLLLF